MNDLADASTKAAQAQAEYDRYREELRRLNSAPEPDRAAIQETIHRLDDAHRRFKESHGLYGNNPAD
jgi:Spy/CpxP family protein refolding chaperone